MMMRISALPLLLFLLTVSRLAPAIDARAQSRAFPDDAVVSILSYGDDLNSGSVDATEAIQQAFDDLSGDMAHRTTLFFPDGVYRISDSVFLEHRNAARSSGSGVGFVLQGESRDGTIIRLTDNNPLFQSRQNPRPVVSNAHTGNMEAYFTNVAFMNSVFDLTIDVGSGNPAAAGLRFIANNQGSVRNVRIVSKDGQGWAALDLARATIPGPALIKNVLPKASTMDSVLPRPTTERPSSTSPSEVRMMGGFTTIGTS